MSILSDVVVENGTYCWVGVSDSGQILRLFSSTPQTRLERGGKVSIFNYGMSSSEAASKEVNEVRVFLKAETKVCVFCL